jgi:glycerol-3-phosphate acyltransferase PlsY
MNILLVILGSYLLGSIPTAYILARLFYKEDVRKKGSGNVGTLNFLRVTHSKILAVVVLILDAAKGYAALWGTLQYAGSPYLLLSSIAVIIGHIFPVWLNWKGGRGLATLAGIFIFLKPLLVLGWWVIFGILYLLLRRYVVAGMVALFFINILTGIFYPGEIFLILSANSVIVYLKYISRIKQELNDHK